jgi:hypothetical protein
MFKRLKHFLARDQRAAIDPASFGDPLAEQVDWSPLSAGGANFRTHRLVPISDFRLEFRSTLGARLFALVFMGFGLLAPVIVFLAGDLQPRTVFASFPFWFGLGFAAIFLGAGAFLWRAFCSPIVFDKDAREYTRKKRLFRGGKDAEFPVDLQRIRGIQVLREWVSGSESSYYSYELNLVLDDTSRAQVVDHGNRDKLVSDAEVLAAFLGVPLWDGSSKAHELSGPEDD